jgi:hypothetical protein
MNVNDPIDRQVAELIRLLNARGGSLDALYNLIFDGSEVLGLDQFQWRDDPEDDEPGFRLLCPPAPASLIDEAERELGFPLPALLKAVYTRIANGGYALRLIGLPGGQGRFDDVGFESNDIVGGYRELQREWPAPKDRPWPEKLIPINNGLGCGMIDYADCGTPEGAIWRGDSGELSPRLPSLYEYFREAIEGLEFTGPDSD